MTLPKNIRIAVAAVTIGLAAAGAAMAASKLHGGARGAAGAGGPAAFVSSGTQSSARMHFDGRGGRHGDDLSAAATYLGISESDLLTQLQSGKTLAQIADATPGKSKDGLVDALVAAEQKELTAAVAAGRLTQAQADQIAANLKTRITDHVTHSGAPAGGPGFGHGGPGGGDDLAAAATYLGLSQAALVTQLQSGKTLAQIADATAGKSTDGLVAALVAHEQDELAQAVKDGRLTQAQADQLTAGLTARFTAMVNGTGFHGGPHGSGGPPPPAHI
jgi:hypothetical protein